jgi:hypothetical protein
MNNSKPHTVRIVSADDEIHTKPSKRAAMKLAYEAHQTRGLRVEVYQGDYVADRRVVDAEPVEVLK